jgi:uncharacterized membrane protein YecN with MAPEG domain
MHIALICIGLLGLLVFGLGFAVSMTRGRSEIVIGCPEDPTHALHKMIRAHGNTTEYAPILALLIFIVGSRDPGTWSVGWMVAATASRYLIASGILLSSTLEKPHPLRFLGAIGTYVSGTALCVALLRSL